MPGRYGLLQRAAGNRAFHGPQDRRRFQHRPYSPRLCQRHLFALCHQYNAKDATAKQRYADIARTVGLVGDDDQLVKALCEKIDFLQCAPEHPQALKEFGVNEEEFLQSCPLWRSWP